MNAWATEGEGVMSDWVLANGAVAFTHRDYGEMGPYSQGFTAEFHTETYDGCGAVGRGVDVTLEDGSDAWMNLF